MNQSHITKADESEKSKREVKKITFIGYFFSVFAFSIFIYTFCFSVEKELKQQSIYWFYTSLISALIPNIKQFKIKDFEVQFKEEIFRKIDEQTKELNKNLYLAFEQVKKSEESLSEEYKTMREKINNEYAEKLQGLSSSEKLKKQETPTRKHLNKFALSINELKQILKQLGFYDSIINEEFNQELADAIIKFQKHCDITPVDGICGLKTLSKLGEFIKLKNTFNK